MTARSACLATTRSSASSTRASPSISPAPSRSSAPTLLCRTVRETRFSATAAATTSPTSAYAATGSSASPGGTASRRRVEAVRCVYTRGRWYVLAHDLDACDWRVFRLDRVREPEAGNRGPATATGRPTTSRPGSPRTSAAGPKAESSGGGGVDHHSSVMRCLGGAVILTGSPHPR
ncbi:WYL domain-containing protein [Nonomuraea sp. NPDC052129]|uniref:WYL domain-containing protein n=1 Tax=Nonomuraea sp. NPDC052129 TaxID=3154651 RepID=UPI00343BA440